MTAVSPKDFLAAAGVGILGALGFPLVIPWLSSEPLIADPLRPLALIVAIGWLAKLARTKLSYKRMATLGWVAGFAHFTVLVYWLIIAMVEFGNMPEVVGLLVLLLLAAYCGPCWQRL